MNRSKKRELAAAAAASSSSARVRGILFILGATVIIGVAGWLVITRLIGPGVTVPDAIAMETSMSGFAPNVVQAKAGDSVRIELVNRDSPYHADGGGWHSFHIDPLNLHAKVGPQSTALVEFTAPTKPGTYDFYCDTCCGGSSNPSMHGKLVVSA